MKQLMSLNTRGHQVGITEGKSAAVLRLEQHVGAEYIPITSLQTPPPCRDAEMVNGCGMALVPGRGGGSQELSPFSSFAPH